MPKQSYMFLLSILLQVIAVFLSKTPDFLAQQQIMLEKRFISSKSKGWNLQDELSLRALSVHQFIKHLNNFYVDHLSILRYILFFFIFTTICSTIAFITITPISLHYEAVMAFILIFSGYSLFVSLPAIFCFLFSWLIVKNKSGI